MGCVSGALEIWRDGVRRRSAVRGEGVCFHPPVRFLGACGASGMRSDQTVRALSELQNNASTARVLNLIRVHEDFPGDPEIEAAPFFRNRLIDRTLIIKHRLRRHEIELFKSPRSVATKIVLPVDLADFRFGARSIFVGESDFEAIATEVFGEDLKRGSYDRRILDLIDVLPTLDPFILKGFLAQNDILPASVYFAISEGDVQRMIEFVRLEISALVHLSTGSSRGASDYVARMVDKLLSNDPNSGFEPLKEVLKLNDQEYKDGMFCWRGFLYYKWILNDLMDYIPIFLSDIESKVAVGSASSEDIKYISRARKDIQNSVIMAISQVHGTIKRYNDAYEGLTKNYSPIGFRDFLISSPELFYDLGQKLGVLQHSCSFWRYRFPDGKKKAVAYEELKEIFLDFEEGLSLVE